MFLEHRSNEKDTGRKNPGLQNQFVKGWKGHTVALPVKIKENNLRNWQMI